MLGVLPALGAEGAADVARDHADLVLGDLEDVGGERVAHAVRVLHVGVERVAVLARVVGPERAARLHVLRVHARDHVAALDDAGGLRERRVRGRLVPGLVEVADVVGALVPYRRAADRFRRQRHGGQGLVVDLDQLRRVLGLRERLRDDESDRITDVARTTLHEPVMRWRPHRRAVRTLALERHLHRAERGDVRAREDSEDTGCFQRGARVDGPNARVRVHRADDDRVRLAGEIDVVVKAALAPNEPGVLEALDALPDPELAH